jgi:hypothetical protein
MANILYDREYTIRARADITTTNPDYRCILVINSGYSDSYYQIQITQQMVAIEDCGVKLNIYEGSSAGKYFINSPRQDRSSS